MDTPNKRRAQILHLLESATTPLSGKQLSEHFAVSRQIIVKDISVLKSQDYTIHATSKGYNF